jgi:hypothetical protein
MIDRRTSRLSALLAVLIAAPLICAACSAPRDPILVEEGMVDIENQTSLEWRNVIVRVNDHFTGGVPALAAGGHLNAPLSQFQTSYGQRFDRGRQSVFKIGVTATDADGKPVTLTWGQDQQKK